MLSYVLCADILCSDGDYDLTSVQLFSVCNRKERCRGLSHTTSNGGVVKRVKDSQKGLHRSCLVLGGEIKESAWYTPGLMCLGFNALLSSNLNHLCNCLQCHLIPSEVPL